MEVKMEIRIEDSFTGEKEYQGEINYLDVHGPEDSDKIAINLDVGSGKENKEFFLLADSVQDLDDFILRLEELSKTYKDN